MENVTGQTEVSTRVEEYQDYEVQEIRDMRFTTRLEMRVKWVGYRTLTWEPISSFFRETGGQGLKHESIQTFIKEQPEKYKAAMISCVRIPEGTKKNEDKENERKRRKEPNHETRKKKRSSE